MHGDRLFRAQPAQLALLLGQSGLLPAVSADRETTEHHETRKLTNRRGIGWLTSGTRVIRFAAAHRQHDVLLVVTSNICYVPPNALTTTEGDASEGMLARRDPHHSSVCICFEIRAIAEVDRATVETFQLQRILFSSIMQAGLVERVRHLLASRCIPIC